MVNRLIVALAAIVVSCVSFGQQPVASGGALPQALTADAPPPPIPTGLLFADRKIYESIPLASTPLMGSLPPSADLTSRFPSPGNQGHQGSCVGWAVAYALKSFQEADERHWPLSSTEHVFSPAYVYNQIRRTTDCLSGTMYIDALNLVRREGVAPWNAFPYDETHCAALPDNATKQLAKQYGIAEWRRVNVQDDTEVKANIAAGFPVLIGIDVDRGFFNLRGDAIYSQYSGASEGGHAIVVIGYDDIRSAFKIINSWGTSWSDHGYGWISYQVFGKITREGYVAQDIVVTPAPPIQPPQPAPPIPVPPVATPPSVTLGIPQITHNIPVMAPNGTYPGMRIQLPGTLVNATGKTVQIVARFAFQNGQILMANPLEGVFRDATGFVAVGTPPIPAGSAQIDLGLYSYMIPYYALNLVPTNGQASYTLLMKVTVYVDNFIVGEQSVPFPMRW